MSAPPALDVLERQLTAVFGAEQPVVVRERLPNPYASRLPSELVQIEAAEGAIRTLFCKHEAERSLDVHGRSAGLGYEAAVYGGVLSRSAAQRASFVGHAADPVTGRQVLVLEPLLDHVRVQESPDSTALMRAAAWAGSFHATAPEPRTGLNVYDLDYYAGWIRRAIEAVPRVAAVPLELLQRPGEILVDAPQVVVHGELYPDNVLVSADSVCPVDWEWAAVAAGEIDLAALTEGWWRDEQVAACIDAYVDARWAGAATPSFAPTLDAARAYLHLRWLGAGRTLRDPGMVDWRCGELERLVARLDKVRAA